MGRKFEDAGGVTELHALPTSPQPVAYVLEVLEGPDRGKQLRIDASAPQRVLLGQSPACEFRLADRHASRRHAAVEMADRRLRIADLESSNGTTVDGVSIVEALLQGGETIRIGESTLRVRRVDDGVATATSNAAQFFGVLGKSPEMQRLYPLCERLAQSDVSIVIEGETGTGKEALSEAIHRASPRAQGPFVVFDCTAVPPNLLESELFGHEKGAFTGAVSTRRGVFEQADGGTLLIDELGELDLSLQPKLLRAVERREVRRLGSEKRISVNVRLLAATRRDLDREVDEGRFRDDLFHRLAVGRIELPPLRKRVGDVVVLATYFADQLGVPASAIQPQVMARWKASPWPGNVRELRNAVARWVALGDLEGEIKVKGPMPSATRESDGALAVATALEGAPAGDEHTENFAASVAEIFTQKLSYTDARRRLLEIFERHYLETMLAAHGGNVTRAAAASGIGRRYFQMLAARRQS